MTEKISIHAPRMGSDIGSPAAIVPMTDFNPRSPHGERHSGTIMGVNPWKNFNPRSPHGERQYSQSIQQ